jgi:hypothetical protein
MNKNTSLSKVPINKNMLNFISDELAEIFSFLVMLEEEKEYIPDENIFKLFTFSVDPIVLVLQCNNITKYMIYSQAKKNFDKIIHQHKKCSLVM